MERNLCSLLMMARKIRQPGQLKECHLTKMRAFHCEILMINSMLAMLLQECHRSRYQLCLTLGHLLCMPCQPSARKVAQNNQINLMLINLEPFKVLLRRGRINITDMVLLRVGWGRIKFASHKIQEIVCHINSWQLTAVMSFKRINSVESLDLLLPQVKKNRSSQPSLLS